MKTQFLSILLLITVLPSRAQVMSSQTLHVLFLGNSYTYVNNLPQLVADMALSTGDTLIYDTNLQGGYTLQNHTNDGTSMNKIRQGGFDYVVLQEQSQLPSFPINQVITGVFPFARMLHDTIQAYNECARTLFYMTWGRKNGDASNCAVWPPVCTYMGMDSLLRLRYLMMADSNQAEVSPVGAVWRYIRQQYPLIELYQTDESHPSLAGSYAAACSFYAAIFRKDPAGIAYDGGLDSVTALLLRQAASAIVFDSLGNWSIGTYDPVASFAYSVSQGTQVSFTNYSTFATSYLWDFGDGDTSSSANPVHLYASNAAYTVTLVSIHCNRSDTLVLTVNLNTGLEDDHDPLKIFIISPNPACELTILSTSGEPCNACQVDIINASGKLVWKTKYDTRLLNVSNWSEGVYQVLVHKNGTVRYSGRMVVVHSDR